MLAGRLCASRIVPYAVPIQEANLEYDMRVANSALAFTSLLVVAWSLACGDTAHPAANLHALSTFTVEAPSTTRSPTVATDQGVYQGEIVSWEVRRTGSTGCPVLCAGRYQRI